MYRKAGDLLTVPMVDLESEDRNWLSIQGDTLTRPQKEFVDYNTVVLDLLLEASAQPKCFFGNPSEESERSSLPMHEQLFTLVAASGLVPDLEPAGTEGLGLEQRAIDFKTQRHVTIATLATQTYRLKRGDLPERFEQLVPEFLERVPLDPRTGQPLTISIPPYQFISSGTQQFAIPPWKMRIPRGYTVADHFLQSGAASDAAPPVYRLPLQPDTESPPDAAPPPAALQPAGTAPALDPTPPDVPAQPAIGTGTPTSPPPADASPERTSDDAAGDPPRNEERP